MKKRNLICGIILLSLLVSAMGCARKEMPAVSNDATDHGNDYKTEASRDSALPTPTYAPLMQSDSLKYATEYSEEIEICPDMPFDFNTEEYSPINENSFQRPLITPLSTFAADVDTASYSNFRRMVNKGYTYSKFPSGAIRTEEMINYFKYNYNKPEGDEPFGVTAVVGDCPWNRDVKLMSIGITTNEMDAFDIPSSNIVFLIDVSGSMMDNNKLPLIKQSMGLLLENFGEDDRISIVTYAGNTNIVLNGEPGNNREVIMDAFNNLHAGGGTNGSSGITLAYETATENFIEGGVNRVILCSDGDFNIGLTSQSELKDLITKKKESGIFLSVLGFGMYNYSDTVMETLADYGNGNYGYIDTLAEAKKILVDEMTSTFVTVAKDVKFQVEFNPATVAEYRLVGYENRAMAAEDFTDDTKDGGELGAGHQVTVLYELSLTDGYLKETNLKYQTLEVTDKGSECNEYCTLSIAYKTPDGDTSSYLEYPIGTDNYTANPSTDFRFAASVAETSLALRDSRYIKGFTAAEALDDALKFTSGMQEKDEYQKEFEFLLGKVIRGY